MTRATPRPLSKPLADLVEEVEELCEECRGKEDAGRIFWRQTLERVAKIEQLVRRVRRDHPKTKPAATQGSAKGAAGKAKGSPWAV